MKLSQRISSILTAMVCTLTLSSVCVTAEDTETTDYGDTRYISYNCATGEESIIDMSKYECDVTYVNSNMPSPRVVIGEDKRKLVSDTTVSPYKGIGYLYCEKPSSTEGSRGTCSAFASNAAITAAHVVWDSDSDEYAQNIQLTFARNGSSKPYGTITTQPTEIIVPEQYKNTQSTNYDYAILIYGTTISNYRFGFKANVSSGTAVTITGYPKDTSTATGGTSNSYQQWTASGSLTASSTYTVSYTIDTTGGQSGAPVYNASNQIVAIHHGGNSSSNTARKLDSALFNLMYQIKNGTYTG